MITYKFRKIDQEYKGVVKDFILDAQYHSERGDELVVIESKKDNWKVALKSGQNFHHSDNDYWWHNNEEFPMIIKIENVLDERLFEL